MWGGRCADSGRMGGAYRVARWEGMMQLDEVRTLFGYDTWATAKILDQAEHLTAEQYAAPVGANGQNIGKTLAHMLVARHLWRVRFETGETALSIGPDDFPTLAAFRAG